MGYILGVTKTVRLGVNLGVGFLRSLGQNLGVKKAAEGF